MLFGAPTTMWARFRVLPVVLRTLAIVLGVIALARPQRVDTTRQSYAEGVDIILVLDTSSSMEAQDFLPNRFEAAKEVAADFVRGRISDRIGLIVFAAQAYTQVPLTLDYPFMLSLLNAVKVGVIEDGTAIGTALATAVNRLKESEAKSKVVILLTDGQNNRGEVDPVTAAEIAAAIGVRVYTIGVGTRGTAPYVMDDPFYGQRVMQMEVEIDEDMLQSVASLTGGQYFRATSRAALETIYNEIGDMEQTRIEEQIYTNYEELYAIVLWPAFLLLLLEVVLANTRLRRFP
jgi:Ca-activated chloride channel family protein